MFADPRIGDVVAITLTTGGIETRRVAGFNGPNKTLTVDYSVNGGKSDIRLVRAKAWLHQRRHARVLMRAEDADAAPW